MHAVAPAAVSSTHLVAMDSFAYRAERLNCTLRAAAKDVGAKRDPLKAERLECVNISSFASALRPVPQAERLSALLLERQLQPLDVVRRHRVVRNTVRRAASSWTAANPVILTIRSLRRIAFDSQLSSS